MIEILMELKEDMSSVKTDLKEHMRRTSLLESAIQILRRHQYMVEGALIFIVAASGIIISLVKLK